MKKLNHAILVALTSTAFYSSAVVQTINVTANIDTTISMTKSNGQPLDNIELKYSGLGKLNAAKTQVRFNTNEEKDIKVSLQEAPKLSILNSDTGTLSNEIPLKVSLGGQVLSTSATNYALSTLFTLNPHVDGKTDSYDLTHGSKPIDLIISAETQLANYISGQYTGTVNLVVEKATTNT